MPKVLWQQIGNRRLEREETQLFYRLDLIVKILLKRIRVKSRRTGYYGACHCEQFVNDAFGPQSFHNGDDTFYYNNIKNKAAKRTRDYVLAKGIGPDFFEPGMMEYPEQSEGFWDEETRHMMLRFESKGTRYDGRTKQVEKVKTGDNIRIT